MNEKTAKLRFLVALLAAVLCIAGFTWDAIAGKPNSDETTYTNEQPEKEVPLDKPIALRKDGLYYPYSFTAKIDINPKTLNLKSKGKWITVYIELPVNVDPHDINVSTVCISKIGSSLVQPIFAECHPVSIGDNDNNGVPDLMVKFSRNRVQECIQYNEEYLSITVEGRLNNGKSFISTDSTRIIHGNDLDYPPTTPGPALEIFNNRIDLNRNENAIVKYNLDEPSYVKITIYNIVGELVKTVVDEYKSAGTFYAMWDGANENGNLVACGLYIIRIKTDSISDARKIIVIK